MKEEKGRQNLISENRRRLLKAAATTAPVVATLQSGAAFAAFSAFNCIDSTATDTAQGIITGAGKDVIFMNPAS